MTYREPAGVTYREPAGPSATKVRPWTTVHGQCPSCGSRPYRGSHQAEARTPERIFVTCNALFDNEGCGATWMAESFSAHQTRPVRWSDVYGPPFAWAVVFAFGVVAGVSAALIAVHP